MGKHLTINLIIQSTPIIDEQTHRLAACRQLEMYYLSFNNIATVTVFAFKICYHRHFISFHFLFFVHFLGFVWRFEQILVLPGHRSALWGLDVSYDGAFCITGGNQSTLSFFLLYFILLFFINIRPFRSLRFTSLPFSLSSPLHSIMIQVHA